MPASSTETLSQIEVTLQASLGGSRQKEQQSRLDSHLVSGSKKVLLQQTLEFQPAVKQSSFQQDLLKSKYVILNSSVPAEPNGGAADTQPRNELKKGCGPAIMSALLNGNDGIPPPKVVLFQPEKVQLEWRTMRKIGAGLSNLGNTCFLNSILQCLSYTAPLTNYLMSEEHGKTCKLVGFCMMCELQRHVKRCIDHSGGVIKPLVILQKLKSIAKHMQWGRQEDAHEFLRYVVDAMLKSCLNGYSKLDKISKETTIVNHIFGGFLRSQVCCLHCRERSNTYDPFLDLSLDIKHVSSLERAMEHYVKPETLDSENAYQCPRCKHKVKAQKRFSIHRAPHVLTIQLKRFDYNRCMGGKVNKFIEFPPALNLRPYMSEKQGDPVYYQLYAVLVHSGHGCNSGHYYCFVRNSNKAWYCMNDSSVSQVSQAQVLRQDAYLLFYTRYIPAPKQQASASTMNGPSKSSTMIGPKLPAKQSYTNTNNNAFKTNGTTAKPSNDTGAPVVRNPSLTSPKPHSLASPGSIPLPRQREKVSFGIKTHSEKIASQSTSTDKPRIVMHIKHGKVFTVETPSSGAVKGKENKLKNKLVPYNDESDSEDQENDAGAANSVGQNKGNGEGNETATAQSSVSAPSMSSSKTNSIDKKGVVMDKNLNATLHVPGSSTPLDKISEKGEGRGDIKAPGHFKGPFSPIKMPSDGLLTLVTSPSHTRLNATNRSWHILEPDVRSPSLASESSNTSINSTTNWEISEKSSPRKQLLLPESQRAGWVVRTDEEYKKYLATRGRDSITPGRTTVNEFKVGKECHSDTEAMAHDDEPVSRKERTEELRKWQRLNSAPAHITLEGKESSGHKSRKEIHEMNQSHKVVVEEEKAGKRESSSESPRRYKEKDQEIKTTDSEVHDKTKLLNGHDSDLTPSTHRKKHKKHKKHKRKHSSEERKHENIDDSYTTTDSSSGKKHKKKKKHKKHKHKHSDKEPLLSSDGEYSYSKHKRHSSDDGESSRKKAKQEEKYEWVEKTRETLDAKDKKDVVVQQWDGPKKESGDAPSVKLKISWDGSQSTKSSNILEELRKNSNRGYGASVSSWDGGRSTVDAEVAQDKKEERNKRQWADRYEEELDRGKTKKVKHHNSDSGFSCGFNPFQKVQDGRNSDRDAYRYSSPPRDSLSYRHHSHRETNHRSGHHTPHRSRDRHTSHSSHKYH